MPKHESIIAIARSTREVFDFLARPANLVQLAPVDLRLELVKGPERLTLGAVVHWKARRMGVSQTLVHAVTAFEEDLRIDEVQQQGPFKRWLFTHRFEAADDGMRLIEEVDYEPPGGMLGLIVTATVIRKDLDALFKYRATRLGEMFGGSA